MPALGRKSIFLFSDPVLCVHSWLKLFPINFNAKKNYNFNKVVLGV